MNRPQRISQRGMTLIELMVALTVGLFLSLAVTSIIVVTLRQQKVTAAVNERDQGANLAIIQLDKTIRSAGSGFSNAWGLGFFGCGLRVSKSSAALVPSTPAAPFNNVVSLKSPVVAPLIIEKGVGGNDSDVLFVMGGNGAMADVPRFITNLTGNSLGFDTAIGYKTNDLLLVATDGLHDCYVTQISATTSAGSTTPPPVIDTVTLGGAYYTAGQVGATSTLAQIVSTNGAYATAIGNTAAAYPSMSLLGAGTDGSLYEYDLLRTRATAPQPIAEDVSHLFALYGIDTDSDGKVDSWVDPGSDAWKASVVVASKQKIRQILAVRVAVVTFTRGVKQANVSPEKLYAFASLGDSLKREITLTDAQRMLRYRVTESVIPLRNNLLIGP